MIYRSILSVLATGTCIVALATPAAAQARSYDIPASDLPAALDRFAQQSGAQIVYKVDEVQGKRSRSVKGSYETSEALRRLLSGSGFEARRDNSGAFAVVRVGNGRGAVERASSQKEETVDSGATNHESADIVVTAQKRTERLIDTPLSISVLSGDTLSRRGATQFRDFADTVPGLSFQTSGAGQSQVTLRGVTTGNDTTATVGIYVDDVPFGSSSSYAKAAFLALDVGLFDVDQIEVLRGPQGTLYGASTMGGLIKYVTSAPDLQEIGGKVSAGLSDTRRGGMGYNAAASINAPIVVDKVAVRASGFYARDGGYIDNLSLGLSNVNRADIYGGRVDLLLEPTERLTIRLGAFIQNIERDGQAVADYNLNGTPVDSSLDQRHPIAEPFEQKFRLVSGTIDYDLDFARLTSISSYQTAKADYVLDNSAVLLPTFRAIGITNVSALGIPNYLNTKKFTQEVRLASSGRQTIEWLVGGFYTHEKSLSNQDFIALDLAGQPLPNTFYMLSLPSKYEEYAAFGNLTWRLSDRFDVQGGVRYAHNRQSLEQIGSGLLASSRPPRSQSDGVFTYLATARFHPSDRATIYARFATGYRPGGPNTVRNDPVTGAPIAQPTFGADTLENYELGFKAETPDRTFAIEGAGYYIDWDNLQVFAVRNGVGVRSNAGGARIKGAELSLTARPSRDFTAAGAFAWQDAELSTNAPDLGGLKGDRLPNVPKFTASIAADYVARDMTIQPSFGASLRFVSDRAASFDASTAVPQYKLPDYASIDLRAGITANPFELQLYVRNLFDTRGQLIGPTLASAFAGPMQISILQPRTIGLSATARF